MQPSFRSRNYIDMHSMHRKIVRSLIEPRIYLQAMSACSNIQIRYTTHCKQSRCCVDMGDRRSHDFFGSSAAIHCAKKPTRKHSAPRVEVSLTTFDQIIEMRSRLWGIRGAREEMFRDMSVQSHGELTTIIFYQLAFPPGPRVHCPKHIPSSFTAATSQASLK